MLEIVDRDGVVYVKGSKHVIEIVPRVDGMPEVYVDGELLKFNEKYKMDIDSDVYRFVTLVKKDLIEPVYIRETGSSSVWIYEFDGRFWINVGCYDDYIIVENVVCYDYYIIVEVDDEKAIIYEAVSTPWKEEIVKYIEIEI